MVGDDDIKNKLIDLRENDMERYNELFDGYFITKYEKRAIELRFGFSDDVEHTIEDIDNIMYREMHNNRQLEKDRKRTKRVCKVMGIHVDTTPALGRQFLAKGIYKLIHYFGYLK